jgi:hypothetical protein
MKYNTAGSIQMLFLVEYDIPYYIGIPEDIGNSWNTVFHQVSVPRGIPEGIDIPEGVYVPQGIGIQVEFRILWDRAQDNKGYEAQKEIG